MLKMLMRGSSEDHHYATAYEVHSRLTSLILLLGREWLEQPRKAGNYSHLEELGDPMDSH